MFDEFKNRSQNMKVLFNELKNQTNNYPTIICGDFNDYELDNYNEKSQKNLLNNKKKYIVNKFKIPNPDIIKIEELKTEDYDNDNNIFQQFKNNDFINCFKKHKNDFKIDMFPYNTNNHGGNVDYIMLSHHFNNYLCPIVHKYYTLKEVSDHSPIITDILFNNQLK